MNYDEDEDEWVVDWTICLGAIGFLIWVYAMATQF